VLITDVVLFDRYAGDRLPEGKVSLALQVTLQPRERTLTDAEIEAVVGEDRRGRGQGRGGHAARLDRQRPWGDRFSALAEVIGHR
jgi:ribosomal protein L19E